MWDTGSSLQFDWENLVMLDGKGNQVPLKLNSSAWGSDIDGIHLHSHACDFGSINGFSGLDAAHVSSVSSKSTSADSSSLGKTSIISVFDESRSASIAVDFAKSKNPAASSVSVEASGGSVEPVIGLKLGKRTYFEDFCSASNAKTLTVSDKPLSYASSRRSRSSHQTMQSLRCQVEGCNVDLSGSKDYHRKHRICVSHSKCPKVIVGGLERRFCQQCSRFHKLSEFDEKKRSCRKRLSDHNARRRKPRSEARHFNLDGKQQVGFVFNMPPNHQARPTLSPWETCGSKFTLTRDYYPFSEKRTAGADHHQYLLGNRISNTIRMQSYNNERSPSKCATHEFLNDGAGECITPSNIAAAQDLRSAPSLLSTNGMGSCNSDPVPIYHQQNNVFQQPETRAVLHLASPQIWGSEPHPSDSPAPLVGFQSNLRPYGETFDLSFGENQPY